MYDDDAGWEPDYGIDSDYGDDYDDLENWELDRLADDAALEREADEVEDQHLDGMYEE